MWLQRWLGEAYSRLYGKFGRGAFSLPDLEGVLNFDKSKLHVAFSLLHKAGAVIIFQRGRPRRYRLLDPRSLVLKTSGEVEEVEFEQEEYLQLIYDVLRAVRGRIELISFCVYGSVARGQAKKSSDLDVLLVSDEFEGSIASRIDLLSFVDEETKEERAFLRKNGYEVAVSLMPLRREEAEASPILFLDLAANAKVLYDEGGFLGGVLTKLKAKLDLAGSRRVETEHGWYWDLKPDYRRGGRVVVI